MIFGKILKENKIRYVHLGREIKNNRQFLKENVYYDRVSDVRFKTVPDNWTIEFEDPSEEKDYVIYRVD